MRCDLGHKAVVVALLGGDRHADYPAGGRGISGRGSCRCCLEVPLEVPLADRSFNQYRRSVLPTAVTHFYPLLYHKAL